jgi:hypothetical protein
MRSRRLRTTRHSEGPLRVCCPGFVHELRPSDEARAPDAGATSVWVVVEPFRWPIALETIAQDRERRLPGGNQRGMSFIATW